jgi:hypothetical protein
MIFSENRFPPRIASGAGLFRIMLEPADERAFHGVDGYAGYFAIAGENCQHIDEAVLAVA